MKENILDVLMYLFENYMDEDTQLSQNQEELKSELLEAGFPHSKINKAFVWLEGLSEQQGIAMQGSQDKNSLRMYSPEECNKLDVDCRGFILFLEQVNILDATSRELVIDRVMALEADEFNLEQLKWVILMVLLNQPGHEDEFAWIEGLMYDEINSNIH